MKVAHAFLTVDDHETAKRFYTEVLGFEVVTDYQADDFRWLSLIAPDQGNDTELVLEQADEEQKRVLASRKAAGIPAISLTIRDGDEFEAIRSRGATVVAEPERQEYGGTDGLIDDGCGNIICLHQD